MRSRSLILFCDERFHQVFKNLLNLFLLIMNNKTYSGGVVVICAYKPKPGKEEDLLSVVREHVPILRTVSLATDRVPQIMKAGDGTIVEVFEWVSSKAIEEAHKNPVVLDMWNKFNDCSNPVNLADLDEAKRLYSDFEPIN